MTALRLLVIAALLAAASGRARGDEAAELTRAFRDRTGAELVFARADLPPGHWFPLMPELSAAQRIEVARLLVAEVQRYPRGWLGRLGLTHVGVFAGLGATHDDGYRWWDDQLGGYRYTGLWNGQDAIAIGYYGWWQLQATLHHELHHAIDTASGFRDDDARFQAAITGARPYPRLAIDPADRALLEDWAGWTLTDAPTAYASKNANEDQADTAAWMHQNLAAALWQAAVHPEWAGSQRILHLLAEYRRVGGPETAWWVDVALGRDPEAGVAQRRFAAAARAGEARVRARIAPHGRYLVRGRAGQAGNPTLRADLGYVDQLVAGLARRADRGRIASADRARIAARWLALIDAYRADIAARWGVSASTATAFTDVRTSLARLAGGDV